MAQLRDGHLKHGIGAVLSRRQDEFSVQYALPTDKRFWIRVALPLTTPIVITDFFPGAQDDAHAAEALAAVLDDLDLSGVGSLEFARLGPAGEPEAAEAVARIGRVIDAYVLASRRFIRVRKVSVDRGQANLRVMFWDATGEAPPAEN